MRHFWLSTNKDKPWVDIGSESKVGRKGEHSWQVKFSLDVHVDAGGSVESKLKWQTDTSWKDVCTVNDEHVVMVVVTSALWRKKTYYIIISRKSVEVDIYLFLS